MKSEKERKYFQGHSAAILYLIMKAQWSNAVTTPNRNILEVHINITKHDIAFIQGIFFKEGGCIVTAKGETQE